MNRLGLALLAMLAAACASRTAVPGPVDFEVPRQWGSGHAKATQPPESWWDEFGDETLSKLIAEALAHNRDLQAAAARVAAAAAAARIEGAKRLPVIAASGNGSRQRRNFVGFPDFTGSGSGPTIFSTTFNQFGVSLDVSWELDLWGRLAEAHRAARAEFSAGETELLGARLSLAAQTAKAWFAMLEANRQLQLAQSTEASYRTSLERVAERYRRGVRPAMDLRLARSELAGARALVAARKRQFDAAQRQLEVLLGRYPAAEISGAAPLPTLTATEVPAGLPADLLSRRPDLVAAAQRLDASGARVRQAKASLLPRIALTSSRGRVSDALSDLTSGDFGVWALATNLTQPIFEGGRLKAGVDLAQAKEEEARAAYVQTALRAYAEVESLLVAEQTEHARERELKRAAAEAEAAWKLANERYTSGLDDFISVLTAERNALSARSRYLSARRERLNTRVDLYLALGGGFSAIDASAVESADARSVRQLVPDETGTAVSTVADRVRLHDGTKTTAHPDLLQKTIR